MVSLIISKHQKYLYNYRPHGYNFPLISLRISKECEHLEEKRENWYKICVNGPEIGFPCVVLMVEKLLC